MNNKLEKNFSEIILDLELWYAYATRLKKASKALEKDNWLSLVYKKDDLSVKENDDHMTTIMMLRGMLIECLFKGILVNRGDITCKDDELCIPNKYSKHDLISMAGDIKDLVFNDEQKKILERLGYYIVAGRLPRKKINIGKFKGYWFSDDEGLYESILEKIESIYSSARKKSA